MRRNQISSSAKRTSPFKLAGGGSHFSRLLAAKVCASAVVVLDTPCSEVACRILATPSIRQFPLYFPSRASPCAITFQLDSNTSRGIEIGEYWTGTGICKPVSPSVRGGNHAPVPVPSQRIPYGQSWDWTRSSAVKQRRVTPEITQSFLSHKDVSDFKRNTTYNEMNVSRGGYFEWWRSPVKSGKNTCRQPDGKEV